MRIDALVAYVYKCEVLCPFCLKERLGQDQSVDIEKVLDLAAAAKGLDREDETTFDSDDFPKVLLYPEVDDGEACCGCANLIPPF